MFKENLIDELIKAQIERWAYRKLEKNPSISISELKSWVMIKLMRKHAIAGNFVRDYERHLSYVIEDFYTNPDCYLEQQEGNTQEKLEDKE